MNNNELFADLFAYRYMLLDIYGYIADNGEINVLNETEIILKLKYKLIELREWRDYNDINGLLFEFYNHYQINITLEEIRNTRVNLHYILNNNIITNFVYNYINRNIIDNNNNNDNNDDEELNTRLTEEEVNRLSIITNEEESEDNCSICFENISIGSMIYRIPCNHKFHINCLKPHLINYNRKCPLCRNDCI